MMKINTRDFLILGMLAICILSQTISTTTSTSTSGSVSADTGSGLLTNLASNIGLNTLLGGSTSTSTNIGSSGSVSNTAGTESSGLLNNGATLNTDALLNTVNGVTSTGSNLLGSTTSNLLNTVDNTLGNVVNTVDNTLGNVVNTVDNTVNTVGSTVNTVGNTLDSITSGITINVDGTVSTNNNVYTNTQLPLLNGNGILDPVLNTVGNVLDPVLNTVGNILPTTVISTLNLETLPSGQVLNTCANLGTPLPVISAATQTIAQVQVGVPLVIQPLLSTLTSTVDNLLSGLLGITLFGTPGFYVDSKLTQAVNKVYNLQGGYIEIEFDFKVVSSIMPTGASLIVFVDNIPIYRVLASESGKRIKISIPTKILKGQHSIGFLPIKSSTTLSFSFYISNLIVFEKQIFPQLIGNLLANGGFEINTCANNFCAWNFKNFLANYVSGWTPVPEIKIVKGGLLNSVLGNGWAVELDVSSNTCIVQNVNLKQGKHILKFNWAARANTQLSTNGILVILNRQLLKGIAPTDYALHTESLEFYINSNASVELALCGAGTPDGYGTLVNNIDLKFEDESLYRIKKY